MAGEAGRIGSTTHLIRQLINSRLVDFRQLFGSLLGLLGNLF
jgi:hypothetical protein